MIYLNKSHTGLRQSSCKQTLITKIICRRATDSILRLGATRLLRDIEHVRSCHLHAEGQFKRLNARLKALVMLSAFRVFRIGFFQKVKLKALQSCIGICRCEISDRFASWCRIAITNSSTLVGGRKKGTSVILRSTVVSGWA